MDEAKYSFNVPLPKGSQYDPTTQLTVRADHVDELRNTIDALFGAGTFDKITGLALRTIIGLGGEETPTPSPAAAAQPQGFVGGAASSPSTPGATSAQPPSSGNYPPAETFGACPDCGVGSIVNKFRTAAKGGGFMGRGCNNYPDCNYMQFWSK